VSVSPDSELYLNRELSLLEFNQRVLAQALDPSTPLLERLFFLSITSTNLDEFFEVRVASHRERATHAPEARTIDGRTSPETLKAVSKRAHRLVADQYKALNDSLLPELKNQGIRLLRRNEWTTEQTEWIETHFIEQVLPALSPIGLDPAHPFPRILNKRLNFVISLSGEDALGREVDMAVLQVPRSLPRVIALPSTEAGWESDWVLLSSVIHANLHRVFESVQVEGCYQFRVTRDGDLWVDEEEVEDLLTALRGELPERRFSRPVRLEVADDCPDSIANYLLRQFFLRPEDLYRVDGPVNLHRIGALRDSVDRPDLKYAPFSPRVARRLRGESSLFEVLDKRPVLLHHPFDSFHPVLDLLQSAAQDPNVLAIMQTLYRTGSDSQVVDALIQAARNGKQVTAVIELRARFDEANNIQLATLLQEAGASVTYGTIGCKTHAKALMIVRREGSTLRRYCHLGTGNYHAKTSKAYTDIGFLTSDEELGQDVMRFFTQLTGVGKAPQLNQLIQSPYHLLDFLLESIRKEAVAARAGKPARIVAKMNACTEPRVIQALYEASQAGVKIDLIVRGACCLRPGVPGLSDNIRVRSIVGRFLEHHRLYYFHAEGEQRLYGSSADWMSRNLVRRVELCFPIADPKIRDRVLRECLWIYLEDGTPAWDSDPDGIYTLQPEHLPANEPAQVQMLRQYAASDQLSDN